MDDFARRALELLRELTGVADAEFRDGQLEAIRAVAERRRKALVVQRTGWGKSAVYFIATRLIRERGGGPTIIVSPLLALMANQLEMAERLSIDAAAVSSRNREEWAEIFGRLDRDEVDVLFVSPERLSNSDFRREVLPGLLASIGLLVIDEVHCISDWGHDFRPDYRRLEGLVGALPPGIPVLGTTATANDRVIRDVDEQLGEDLEVFRGTLERESLALQVIDMPNKAERMAWLAHHVPRLSGTGIIYCLTVRDAERVGSWLESRGIVAASYTGPTEGGKRLEIERQLSAGELKVVVATSALAMGYDNPHIEFVIHYQTPGSAIAYYQQVGRAGRAVEKAYGIAMTGWEDTEIQDWFIETAFPSEAATSHILDVLAGSDGLTLSEIASEVNLRRGRIEATLKILEVEGAVYRDGATWFRSAKRWVYPRERIEAVTEARRAEQSAMVDYATTESCLMQFLRRELDDASPGSCGRCANEMGPLLDPSVDPADPLIDEALRWIRRENIVIEPRRQMPAGFSGRLDLGTHNMDAGRALTRWGDPGLAGVVRRGKYELGEFPDSVVEALVELIREWRVDPFPTWITCVPDRQGNDLVDSLARRVAARLHLPFVAAVQRVRNNPPQKEMQNTSQQLRNVIDVFRVDQPPDGPVFLIDDMVDSRWTLTVIANRLRAAGSGPVYPAVLADSSGSAA